MLEAFYIVPTVTPLSIPRSNRKRSTGCATHVLSSYMYILLPRTNALVGAVGRLSFLMNVANLPCACDQR